MLLTQSRMAILRSSSDRSSSCFQFLAKGRKGTGYYQERTSCQAMDHLEEYSSYLGTRRHHSTGIGPLLHSKGSLPAFVSHQQQHPQQQRRNFGKTTRNFTNQTKSQDSGTSTTQRKHKPTLSPATQQNESDATNSTFDNSHNNNTTSHNETPFSILPGKHDTARATLSLHNTSESDWIQLTQQARTLSQRASASLHLLELGHHSSFENKESTQNAAKALESLLWKVLTNHCDYHHPQEDEDKKDKKKTRSEEKDGSNRTLGATRNATRIQLHTAVMSVMTWGVKTLDHLLTSPPHDPSGPNQNYHHHQAEELAETLVQIAFHAHTLQLPLLLDQHYKSLIDHYMRLALWVRRKSIHDHPKDKNDDDGGEEERMADAGHILLTLLWHVREQDSFVEQAPERIAELNQMMHRHLDDSLDPFHLDSIIAIDWFEPIMLNPFLNRWEREAADSGHRRTLPEWNFLLSLLEAMEREFGMTRLSYWKPDVTHDLLASVVLAANIETMTWLEQEDSDNNNKGETPMRPNFALLQVGAKLSSRLEPGLAAAFNLEDDDDYEGEDAFDMYQSEEEKKRMSKVKDFFREAFQKSSPPHCLATILQSFMKSNLYTHPDGVSKSSVMLKNAMLFVEESLLNLTEIQDERTKGSMRQTIRDANFEYIAIPAMNQDDADANEEDIEENEFNSLEGSPSPFLSAPIGWKDPLSGVSALAGVIEVESLPPDDTTLSPPVEPEARPLVATVTVSPLPVPKETPMLESPKDNIENDTVEQQSSSIESERLIKELKEEFDPRFLVDESNLKEAWPYRWNRRWGKDEYPDVWPQLVDWACREHADRLGFQIEKGWPEWKPNYWLTADEDSPFLLTQEYRDQLSACCHLGLREDEFDE